ncbi:MAG: sugar ABC transporter permease [Clostridia bacterium]|nr:sugar ABC transporter permease [Clostridia bacterium]
MRTKRKRSILRRREDRQKLALCLLPMLKIFLFAYLPMVGFLIAFEHYRPRTMFLSEWVWFDNFEVIFKNKDIWQLFANAVILNGLYTVFGTIAGVLLALFLFEIKNSVGIRIAQAAYLLPLFVSWPLIGLFVNSLLDVNGLLTGLLHNLGVKIDFYSNAKYWRTIMTCVHIWRSAGITMMGYYAVLLNTDKEIYEAATLDGAGRFRCMWTISMSNLQPMIILGFIQACGNIVRSDFSMNFFIIGGRTQLYEKVDVMESYMYRALMNASNFGNMIAMDLTQGVIGLVMSLGVNLIIKKISPEQAIF